ncbi:MAG: cyanophycinase [Frankiales bacterium]|nr:cyanophycinase [Frankiales bacterium]
MCLQGGAEFSPGCRDMDADLVRRAPGRVVVSALAGTVGRDYATASANGVRHFRSVGAPDVVAAPDAREDPDAALASLRTADLLVLPGGSPSRLLEALQSTGAGEVVAERLAAGSLVMGSSAGAMVLSEWTVLPDRRGASGMQVVPGLGLVPGVLVLPHWSGSHGREDWLRAVDGQVPDDLLVLGLPEESGLLVDGGGLTAVGRSASQLVRQQTAIEPGTTWRPA